MRAYRASRARLLPKVPPSIPKTSRSIASSSRVLARPPAPSSSLQNNMALWLQPHYSTHHTPGFSSLFRLLDDFDKHSQQSVSRPESSLQNFSPKFDVTEHEKSYVLKGELPGVPPENVTIEFTDAQTLVVRGEVQREVDVEVDPSSESAARIEQDGKEQTNNKSEENKKNGQGESKEVTTGDNKSATTGAQPKYWLTERSYGEFSRVFHFPAGVDQDKVEAKFEHGVLKIKVPKAEKKGARKIDIK